jgi:peptide/nickel transport system ATP-binding protein
MQSMSAEANALPPREVMEFDVVIVGAGPAGLATAIRLRQRAIEALASVRIPDPERRYHAYPFELSGGLCQRIMIAIALACSPSLLVADEPTTGLDVTTQAAVMDLIGELAHKRNMSTVLITHDLGLAAEHCDRIVVMEKGEVVEQQDTAKLFTAPVHPYTRRLIRSTPHAAATIRDLELADVMIMA